MRCCNTDIALNAMHNCFNCHKEWKVEMLVAQLCPTFCNPLDYSPPGSSIDGIFQARIRECIAISFSRGSSQSRDWTHVFCVSCIGRQIFPTALPEKSVCVCVCVYSSVSGHLSCFYTLAIVTSAVAVVSFQIIVLFWYMPGSWISGPCDIFIFSFLRNL